MIEYRQTAIPLSDPLETAQDEVDHRDCFLVHTTDPDGVGEASPLPGWTESVRETMAALDRLCASTDRAGPGELDSLLETPAARHGVSLALLDGESRNAGKPLYRYLGADAPVETVPANATIGDGDVTTTVTAAESARADGFGCLKIKIGSRRVEADIERVEAVRDRLPDVDLRLDVNGAWTRSQAQRAIEQLRTMDIDYLEQPLVTDDLQGHVELRGPIDIAVDESMRAIDLDEIISAEAADVIVVKPMVVGGIDRARTLATRARAAGLEVVISNTIDGVIARTGAVHLAASLMPIAPCGLATADRLETDLAPDPAPVENGTLPVPQGPGVGVEVTW